MEKTDIIKEALKHLKKAYDLLAEVDTFNDLNEIIFTLEYKLKKKEKNHVNSE